MAAERALAKVELPIPLAVEEARRIIGDEKPTARPLVSTACLTPSAGSFGTCGGATTGFGSHTLGLDGGADRLTENRGRALGALVGEPVLLRRVK